MDAQRQIALTEGDFYWLRNKLRSCSGIILDDSKQDFIYSRLVGRLRALKLVSFSDYIKILRDDSAGDELQIFLNALTTNFTSFFREKHHFKILTDEVLSKYSKSRGEELLFWSAGCSTGEEPYSIALTVCDYERRKGSSISCRVLATDLDSAVLKTASEGIYPWDSARSIAPELLKLGFYKGTGGNAGRVKLREGIKDRIQFRQLNLLGSWPMKKLFDVIFCRNVLIYFDKETEGQLIDKFAANLKPGGILFLGHSEAFGLDSKKFVSLGRTSYRKL